MLNHNSNIVCTSSLEKIWKEKTSCKKLMHLLLSKRVILFGKFPSFFFLIDINNNVMKINFSSCKLSWHLRGITYIVSCPFIIAQCRKQLFLNAFFETLTFFKTKAVGKNI